MIINETANILFIIVKYLLTAHLCTSFLLKEISRNYTITIIHLVVGK